MNQIEIQREVIGYIIGNYFINKNTWVCLTNNEPIREEELGLLYKGKVVIDNKAYLDIATLLTKENYSKVLQILEESGIVVRKFLYIKTEGKLEKDTKFKLDSFWSTISYPFMYLIYNTETKEELGYMLTLNNMYETSKQESMYIGMFEVFNKREHIGTEIIQELRTYTPRIQGLSTKQAKPFWSSIGARYLDDELHFCLK